MVPLDGAAIRRLLDENGARGLAGGAINDALIVACAVTAEAGAVLTFNARQFRLLAPADIRVIVPSWPIARAALSRLGKRTPPPVEATARRTAAGAALTGAGAGAVAVGQSREGDVAEHRIAVVEGHHDSGVVPAEAHEVVAALEGVGCDGPEV